jgi:osmotically-inducible protein OsmY
MGASSELLAVPTPFRQSHRRTLGLKFKQEDAAIRDRLLAHLKAQRWAHTALLNVTVYGGLVHLWGVTSSEIERKAIRVAAESTTGVHAVFDHLVTGSHFARAHAIQSKRVL